MRIEYCGERFKRNNLRQHKEFRHKNLQLKLNIKKYIYILEEKIEEISQKIKYKGEERN